MPFDVFMKPTTNNGTDLDDQGFVGGTDVIEFSVTYTGPAAPGTIGPTAPGANAIAVRQFLQFTGQLPLEGFVHPDSGLSVLRSVNLTALSPVYYEGSLNYTAARRPQGEGEDQNPWDLPPKFKFAAVTADLPIDTDYEGEAIANPGTMEPVDGVTAPITDLSIVITRNILTLTPVLIADFSNKINSDIFLGFSPGLCKTGDITADPQSHNGITYYSLTVPILVRAIYGGVTAERAWWHRRVLKGYYEVIDGPNDASGNPTTMIARALDDEGQPMTERVFLDNDGRRLAADPPVSGAPAGTPPTFTPIYRETRRHGTRAFSTMGLL